jgi:hypothetical protein
LRAELIERGYEVIGFAGVSEALGALRQGLYGRPMLIILELKDLRDGDERIRALAEQQIPTIYLLGAAEEATGLPHGLTRTVWLKRPFTIGRLTEEVEKRLKPEGGEAANSKRQNPDAR